MESIRQEFIENCVQEDIDLYYSLHPNPTNDLINYCLEMTEELINEYQLIY